VFDLPPVEVATVEHRAQRKRCHCGHETTASFPPEATGPTCYGPSLRALVCYLVVRQHIAIKRVAELLRDSYGIAVSTGTPRKRRVRPKRSTPAANSTPTSRIVGRSLSSAMACIPI
jgi:transposase